MNITHRKIDFNNPAEMQSIAAIDMTIPALYDSLFTVNEKTIAERLEQLMKCKPDDFCEMAETDQGRMIGYLIMRRFKTAHGIWAADVETLWVEPEFRNQGVATSLKQRGEAWAKACHLDHIATFVHAKNSSMLKLNQSLGFELVGYKLRKKISK